MTVLTGDLFAGEWTADESPIEDAAIKQKLLYYSEEEHQEFNRLAKIGMRIMWPSDLDEANQSDLILNLLREKYGNIEAKESSNAGESRGVEGNVSE
jgi:hypothetical protein